jgi:phosphoribosylanthranilate isomerase
MTFAPTDNSSMNAGRIRVKFCGITRAQDAVDAAALGADAIGLVFYANSPRALTPAQAAEIAAVLPPFVSTVALFVNPGAVRGLSPALHQGHPDGCRCGPAR